MKSGTLAVAPQSAAVVDGADIDPRRFNLFKASYTVEETCRELGLGTSTLYKIVRAGRLHPRKEGKLTLFLAGDLARYLASLPEKSSGAPSDGEVGIDAAVSAGAR